MARLIEEFRGGQTLWAIWGNEGMVDEGTDGVEHPTLRTTSTPILISLSCRMFGGQRFTVHGGTSRRRKLVRLFRAVRPS